MAELLIIGHLAETAETTGELELVGGGMPNVKPGWNYLFLVVIKVEVDAGGLCEIRVLGLFSWKCVKDETHLYLFLNDSLIILPCVFN